MSSKEVTATEGKTIARASRVTRKVSNNSSKSSSPPKDEVLSVENAAEPVIEDTDRKSNTEKSNTEKKSFIKQSLTFGSNCYKLDKSVLNRIVTGTTDIKKLWKKITTRHFIIDANETIMIKIESRDLVLPNDTDYVTFTTHELIHQYGLEVVSIPQSTNELSFTFTVRNNLFVEQQIDTTLPVANLQPY